MQESAHFPFHFPPQSHTYFWKTVTDPHARHACLAPAEAENPAAIPLPILNLSISEVLLWGGGLGLVQPSVCAVCECVNALDAEINFRQSPSRKDGGWGQERAQGRKRG